MKKVGQELKEENKRGLNNNLVASNLTVGLGHIMIRLMKNDII